MQREAVLTQVLADQQVQCGHIFLGDLRRLGLKMTKFNQSQHKDFIKTFEKDGYPDITIGELA